MMKLGIMQPYFLPYIGYFQLIAAVDRFVVYDNIKYTKKGWINRNRFLLNGTDAMFSIPLRKDSDSLDVYQRELAVDFNRDKLLNQLKGAYRRAAHFDEAVPLIERIVRYPERNLFLFIKNAILEMCNHLGIATPITVSSSVSIDHELKAQEKVLALCGAMDASIYVNAIGGLELYSKQVFREKGIELKFIQSLPFEYPQFGGPFVPSLSILDVIMFNSPAVVRQRIVDGYVLV